MNNSKGKTLTIFVILIAVLLVSSTAIGFFMYQTESQKRKDVEAQLDESRQQQQKLALDLTDAKKQITLLQDKNKEADAKINNLMDEIELNQGLHTALKKENSTLKETLDNAKKEKDGLRADLEAAAKKLQENLEMLKAEQSKTRELQAQIQKMGEQASVQSSSSSSKPSDAVPAGKDKMELGKIIVQAQDGLKGQVLSVDRETEFIVCSLGAKNSVKMGDLLAIYRGDQYIGDVKVSRVQDEISAADFVAPLSSRDVRKNDIVVPKQS